MALAVQPRRCSDVMISTRVADQGQALLVTIRASCVSCEKMKKTRIFTPTGVIRGIPRST